MAWSAGTLVDAKCAILIQEALQLSRDEALHCLSDKRNVRYWAEVRQHIYISASFFQYRCHNGVLHPLWDYSTGERRINYARNNRTQSFNVPFKE